MNIRDLPDDVLVHLFQSYFNFVDLISLSETCERFAKIIDDYHIWLKYVKKLPLLDLNYPYGYDEQFLYSKNYHEKYKNSYKMKKYLNLKDNKVQEKVIYSYQKRMLPQIQLDEESNDLFGYSSLLLTDANKLCCLNLNQDNNEPRITTTGRQQSNKMFTLFKTQDIRSFRKKSNILVSFCENKINVHTIVKSSTTINHNNHNEQHNLTYTVKPINQRKDLGVKIKCADFSIKLNKLIYGCSSGFVKVFNLRDGIHDSIYERNDSLISEPVGVINVGDRILKCSFSPSLKNIAVGSAGVYPHKDQSISPLRVYDFEKLKETFVLKPLENYYKLGAGVLAMSFIDENLLLSGGYDTFIRIFDLRLNKCVQSMEEPEDMSIYCVCCSKYYGLLSGNDRYSIIRYWDRRQGKIIRTFNASNTNSSIYSLACSPDSIYAAWDHGITLIDYR